VRLIDLDRFRKKWLGIAKTYEACALSALRRGAGEAAEEYGEEAHRCAETAASFEAQIQGRLLLEVSNAA
jgi:hypothetical protein